MAKKKKKKKGDDNEGRILTFRGKYGREIYDASTEQKALSAFLHHIVEYYGPEGHWLSAEEHLQELKADAVRATGVDLDEDKIEGLPKSLQREANKLVEQARREAAYRASEIEFCELCVKAIKNSNGEAAQRACEMHQDHEYEEYSFEYLTNAQELTPHKTKKKAKKKTKKKK